MENVLHWGAGLAVAGLLVVAAPQMVHQAASDEGDGWSGACPGYESHAEVWEVENSLPLTVEMEVERW